jgi:hypothetical protein
LKNLAQGFDGKRDVQEVVGLICIEEGRIMWVRSAIYARFLPQEDREKVPPQIIAAHWRDV